MQIIQANPSGPQTPIWPFLEIEKRVNEPMNQFVSFAWFGAGATLSVIAAIASMFFYSVCAAVSWTPYNQHPKAFERPLLVIRLRWERVWRFLNTGGWWWCRRGGWCRFLFHYLQYSPSWLSNVRRLAMNIEKVSWLHTMTHDLFWHWLRTSTAPKQMDSLQLKFST